MLLTANICLTGCIGASVFLSKVTFTLQNDLKRIEYENTFCYMIAYLIYGTAA